MSSPPDPRDAQGWLDELGAHRASARPCVLVVVTGVEGSAPREAGTRMIVSGGGHAWGTVGGGNLERLAIERALELLADESRGAETVAVPLAEKAGQCCGGRVTLFLEPFRWSRRTVAIFGAGHVGQALGALAPWLPADVRLIDGRTREELVPEPPAAPPYTLDLVDAPEEEIDALPAGALVVVMTHSHALDQTILERALARGGFPYLGLIGSERKWRRFQARLAQRGFTPEQLATITCPIGVGKVSKEPRAIALSVATQLGEVLTELGAPAEGSRASG